MLPDVICTCPQAFPARQKHDTAKAKPTKNLRIEHPPKYSWFVNLTTWSAKNLRRDDLVSIGCAPRDANGTTLRLDGSRSKRKLVEITRREGPDRRHANKGGSIKTARNAMAGAHLSGR